MGDLTYDQIETEVKKELLDRDDLDVVIQNAIQHAHQEIGTVFRHFELEELAITNLIVGYRRYTLPADLRTIITVRDETAGRRIQKEDYRIFDDMGIFTSGPLTRYARYGNYIEFDHYADSTNQITIRYNKKVSTFSGSETSYLAPEWDEAIVLGAIYRVLQRIKEYEQSEIVKQRYIELVQSRTDPRDIEDEDIEQSLGVRIER